MESEFRSCLPGKGEGAGAGRGADPGRHSHTPARTALPGLGAGPPLAAESLVGPGEQKRCRTTDCSKCLEDLGVHFYTGEDQL
ncbi:hypothetical protein AV530_001234 [Patagioenas fasciata monilis]|uniref:Uncharacterized protein n=1 Tax=Patagioenas fasciata monilis TaxID=372326 RepID=A0A1V4JQ82_PATFA|nr:hypothetical protein AV530_001234 [Patagioenas fasciata monilis]